MWLKIPNLHGKFSDLSGIYMAFLLYKQVSHFFGLGTFELMFVVGSDLY